MIVQCCVCKKIRIGQNWRAPAGHFAISELVSHGYCPECAAEAFAMLRREANDIASRRASVA
jgi:hypothetical protein